ncbi:hypothetical protein MMC08_008992 [Hypocenomyce scalaris]|nr:hypothetical protein [Hypocenomyce scalaris]
MTELDKVLKRYVNGESGSVGAVQGAALIVKARNGATIYSNAFGKLTLDADSPPFTGDAVCWGASLTKLVTAISAMQLVEKGTIGLDDDVGNVVPELANKDILKGFDMGRRFCGFCYDTFDPEMLKWSASIGRTVDSESDTLEGYSFPLSFEPGEGWMYGVGLNWVGPTIEILCNCSLEEYMQEHIFKPLGMSSTTLLISKHPGLSSRRAVIGFRASPRGLLAAGGDPAPQDPAMISGGSGLFCTANDYATLLGLLISNDGKLLKEESFQTGIAAVLMVQVLPMGDAVVASLYDELEQIVYKDLVE